MTLLQVLSNNKVKNTYIINKPKTEDVKDKQLKDITLIKLLSGTK